MDDIVEIQSFVNSYLKDNGYKTITEVLGENNKNDSTDKLNKHYVLTLQQIICKYTKENGIDINEEINSNEGRKQVLGLMSNTEVKYIRNIMDEYYKNEDNKKIVK